MNEMIDTNNELRDLISISCSEVYDEPMGSNDLSDDGDALASAGLGTNEDYGSGEDRFLDSYYENLTDLGD